MGEFKTFAQVAMRTHLFRARRHRRDFSRVFEVESRASTTANDKSAAPCHKHKFFDRNSLLKMDTKAGLNADDSRLVFESSESVKVVSTFDQFGLKEDLLRGIYAYSESDSFTSAY